MHLGLRLLQGDTLQAFEEGVTVGHRRVEPEDPAMPVDADDEVLRLAFAYLVALLGQGHRHREVHHRDGDEEDDQQHQHHVHQRRGVDLGDQAVLAFAGILVLESHQGATTAGVAAGAVMGTEPDASSTVCRSDPNARTVSITTLLRRTSQL